MRRLIRSSIAALGVALVSATSVQAQEGFSHDAHDGLFPLCTGCHEVEGDGSVSFPAEDSCVSCHDGEEEPPVEWSAPAPSHRIDHRFHEDASAAEPGCSDCHGPVEVSVIRSGCAECHAEHHGGEAVRCRACHGESPQAEHTVAAHAGCGGSGCHDPDAVSLIRFERELCLLCHRDMLDHRPGRRCGRCHAVGQPGG